MNKTTKNKMDKKKRDISPTTKKIVKIKLKTKKLKKHHDNFRQSQILVYFFILINNNFFNHI